MLLSLRVSRVRQEAAGIRSYQLVATDASSLPAFTPGAHIDLQLPSGIVRPYSLVNYHPDEDGYYEIGVLRTSDSRGGSVEVHQSLQLDRIINICGLRNQFQLNQESEHSILLAGGIGITPLLSMHRCLLQMQSPHNLHYFCRSQDTLAFADRLYTTEGIAHVHCHIGLDLASTIATLDQILAGASDKSQIYCCGPAGFIDHVRNATVTWSGSRVRFERFSASNILPEEKTNQAFEIELASSGRVYSVGANQTILQVLREQGFKLDSQCEQGLCGTCETGLLEGVADHRDSLLTEAERAEQNALMICCSRARSARLKLDL